VPANRAVQQIPRALDPMPVQSSHRPSQHQHQPERYFFFHIRSQDSLNYRGNEKVHQQQPRILGFLGNYLSSGWRKPGRSEKVAIGLQDSGLKGKKTQHLLFRKKKIVGLLHRNMALGEGVTQKSSVNRGTLGPGGLTQFFQRGAPALPWQTAELRGN